MLYAAIDIGSYLTTMKIIEIIGDRTTTLETITRVIPLGEDTFLSKKISRTNADVLIRTLEGFKGELKAYGIRRYRIVATSAFREAKNRDFLIEQIHRETAMRVDVISNAEEKYLLFKASKADLKLSKETSYYFLNIGYGNVQLTRYDRFGIRYNQSFKLGTMRIYEVLQELEGHTLFFADLIESYIRRHLVALPVPSEDENEVALVVYGREMDQLLAPLGGQRRIDAISVKDLAYRAKIKKEQDLSPQHQLPGLMLLDQLIDLTDAKTLDFPPISLVDGLLREEIENRTLKKKERILDEDLISYVRNLALTTDVKIEHIRFLETVTSELFGKVKKRLTHPKDRLLLKLSCFLRPLFNDAATEHWQAGGFETIQQLDFPGLSTVDKTLIAILCRFDSAELLIAYLEDKRHTRVFGLRASKLFAIMMIADALDYAKEENLYDLIVKKRKDTITITGNTHSEALLETWQFNAHKDFFTEVFGVSLELTLTRY